MSQVFVGNLTRDPELRFAKTSGKPWVSSGLAVTPREQDADGNWVDGETAFYDLVVFGDQAERVAEAFARGTRVIVVGRTEEGTPYEGRNGTVTPIKLFADEIGPSVKNRGVAVLD